MKSCYLSCILLLLLSGCDFFDLKVETEIASGRWASNVVPQAGDCCYIDLTLDINDGEVDGTGTVGVPNQRLGSADEFAVAVTGTIIRERINLSFESSYNPGTIEGVIRRNYSQSFDAVLQVNFEGFGMKGRDIILFPRK